MKFNVKVKQRGAGWENCGKVKSDDKRFSQVFDILACCL